MRTSAASLHQELFSENGSVDLAGAGKTQVEFGPASSSSKELKPTRMTEYGVSKGRLLPRHHIFPNRGILPGSRRKLEESLVLVHGGMAQDVGPILEMVTPSALCFGMESPSGCHSSSRPNDCRAETRQHRAGVGRLTQQNFDGPLKAIIPWATNEYAEAIIEQVDEEFGNDFWGFWMFGGMAGGGMGFLFAP